MWLFQGVQCWLQPGLQVLPSQPPALWINSTSPNHPGHRCNNSGVRSASSSAPNAMPQPLYSAGPFSGFRTSDLLHGHSDQSLTLPPSNPVVHPPCHMWPHQSIPTSHSDTALIDLGPDSLPAVSSTWTDWTLSVPPNKGTTLRPCSSSIEFCVKRVIDRTAKVLFSFARNYFQVKVSRVCSSIWDFPCLCLPFLHQLCIIWVEQTCFQQRRSPFAAVFIE